MVVCGVVWVSVWFRMVVHLKSLENGRSVNEQRGININRMIISKPTKTITKPTKHAVITRMSTIVTTPIHIAIEITVETTVWGPKASIFQRTSG